MKKTHLLIALVVLVGVAIVSYVLLQSPAYSASDFENKGLVLQNPRLPEEELRLRLEENKNSESPRVDEDPKEAARDAFEDYLRAGLYEEAQRVMTSIESDYNEDASFWEIKGDLAAAMRQYKDAVIAYSASLELGGERGRIYSKLAELYLFNSTLDGGKQKERALALYKGALKYTTDADMRNELRIKIEALKDSF